MFRFVLKTWNCSFPITFYKGTDKRCLKLFYLINKTYPFGQVNSVLLAGATERAFR